jgi:hypothetical protein
LFIIKKKYAKQMEKTNQDNKPLVISLDAISFQSSVPTLPPIKKPSRQRRLTYVPK